MTTDVLPRYITRCTIQGRHYYKAQRWNNSKSRTEGAPTYQFQKCFVTLEEAIAFVDQAVKEN